MVCLIRTHAYVDKIPPIIQSVQSVGIDLGVKDFANKLIDFNLTMNEKKDKYFNVFNSLREKSIL
jgi:hypothetical protein